MEKETETKAPAASETRRELADQAFREQFEMLCRFSFTITRDSETAKEITSEAFTRLLHSQPELEEESVKGVVRYLCACIRNLSLNWMRDQKLREHLSLDSGAKDELPLFSQIPSPEEGVEEQVIRQDRYAKLYTAINRLPPNQQECVRLHYIEGLSHDEVAKRLNITSQASRSLGSRALRKLRAILQNSD